LRQVLAEASLKLNGNAEANFGKVALKAEGNLEALRKQQQTLKHNLR
jgi:hypothetical protein